MNDQAARDLPTQPAPSAGSAPPTAGGIGDPSTAPPAEASPPAEPVGPAEPVPDPSAPESPPESVPDPPAPEQTERDRQLAELEPEERERVKKTERHVDFLHELEELGAEVIKDGEHLLAVDTRKVLAGLVRYLSGFKRP